MNSHLFAERRLLFEQLREQPPSPATEKVEGKERFSEEFQKLNAQVEKCRKVLEEMPEKDPERKAWAQKLNIAASAINGKLSEEQERTIAQVLRDVEVAPSGERLLEHSLQARHFTFGEYAPRFMEFTVGRQQVHFDLLDAQQQKKLRLDGTNGITIVFDRPGGNDFTVYFFEPGNYQYLGCRHRDGWNIYRGTLAVQGTPEAVPVGRLGERVESPSMRMRVDENVNGYTYIELPRATFGGNSPVLRGAGYTAFIAQRTEDGSWRYPVKLERGASVTVTAANLQGKEERIVLPLQRAPVAPAEEPAPPAAVPPPAALPTSPESSPPVPDIPPESVAEKSHPEPLVQPMPAQEHRTASVQKSAEEPEPGEDEAEKANELPASSVVPDEKKDAATLLREIEELGDQLQSSQQESPEEPEKQEGQKSIDDDLRELDEMIEQISPATASPGKPEGDSPKEEGRPYHELDEPMNVLTPVLSAAEILGRRKKITAALEEGWRKYAPFGTQGRTQADAADILRDQTIPILWSVPVDVARDPEFLDGLLRSHAWALPYVNRETLLAAMEKPEFIKVARQGWPGNLLDRVWWIARTSKELSAAQLETIVTLSGRRFGIHLDALERLTPDEAEELGKQKGYLYLPNVKELSVEAAQALTQRGNTEVLNIGVESLQDPALARALGNVGRLRFSNLKEMDAAAETVLAESRAGHLRRINADDSTLNSRLQRPAPGRER